MAEEEKEFVVEGSLEGHFYYSNGNTEQFEVDILKLDAIPAGPEPFDMEDSAGEVVQEKDSVEDVVLSPYGILDEETVSRGLSKLGRAADGMQQVYLNCAVPGFSLFDITILGEYEQLQRVEIPYNNIRDLSPLGKLPHLLSLDASHNNVAEMLDFKPPFNLMEVDLSFNQLTDMRDMSAHHALKRLLLDNNNITDIKGLQKCHRLQHLSLAHNQISVIQGLDNLPIRHLNLCNNEIKKIENLETLKYLQVIILAGNCIRSLHGLDNHDMLEEIDLEDNEVIDISEIQHIQQLRMLRDLNLLRNPIQELPDCRLAILFRIPNLTELDRHKVDVEEKVSAKDLFDPSMEVVAARDHIMHTVYNFLQPSRVWDSTLPNIGTPYPMLVLVGPPGSGKKDLAFQLVNEFSDYFGYGITHTTRPPRKDEEHGKDHFFVTMDKFEIDIKMGQFVQTNRSLGHWYGLQMESIESVAREGLACVVHMELEGVLTLKNTYFEPRYVLVMPLDKEVHERRLRNRGQFKEEEIFASLKRAEIYAKYNRDHPGFFDMMINTENIGEAYRRLRHLVMDYLGIAGQAMEMKDLQNLLAETGETNSQAAAVGPATSTMGTRKWSRPSASETGPQGRISASANTRGIVEEESYKRRQSAAQEVISGRVPPIFDQILTKYPRTAPQSVEAQQGLGSEPVIELQMDFVPNDDSNPLFLQGAEVPRIPGSPNSSSSSSEGSSNLSDLDSATEFQRPASAKGPSGGQLTTSLPTEKVNPLSLFEENSYTASTSRLPDPRPPSGSRLLLGSGQGSRPGSDRHKVLPPIAAQ